MKCPICNQEINEGSMFCPYCGADLSQTQPSNQPGNQTGNPYQQGQYNGMYYQNNNPYQSGGPGGQPPYDQYDQFNQPPYQAGADIQNGSSKTALIVGIVCGVVALAATALILIFFVFNDDDDDDHGRSKLELTTEETTEATTAATTEATTEATTAATTEATTEATTRATTEATTAATTEAAPDVLETEWKISEIVVNESKDDYTTDYTDIYSSSSIYFHWKVLDGPYDENIQFYVEVDDRAVDNSNTQNYTFEGTNDVGDIVWYNEYSYNTNTGEKMNFKEGTITIRVYNAYTYGFLGEKTVHLH